MDEPEFWTEMRADPDNDLVRNAYADWLDEQGDPLADWVRASVRESRLHPLTPGRLRLRALVHRMFQQAGGRFRDQFEARHPRMHRGMLLPRVDGQDFLKKSLLDVVPLLGVWFSRIRGQGHPMRFSEDLAKLVAVSLYQTGGRTADFHTLFTLTEFENLRSLTVHDQSSHVGLGESLVKGRFPKLERLRLTRNMLTAAEIGMLAESDLLRKQLSAFRFGDTNTEAASRLFSDRGAAEKLKTLELVDQFYPPYADEANQFLTDWEFPELETFTLTHGGFTPSRFARVASGWPKLRSLTVRIEGTRFASSAFPRLPELRHLSLCFDSRVAATDFSGPDVSGYLNESFLHQLETVQLGDFRGDAINRLLLMIAGSKNLRTLSLLNCNLPRGSMRLLTESDAFSTLERLEFQGCRLGTDDLLQLIDHAPESIVELDLSHNEFAPGTVTRLLQSDLMTRLHTLVLQTYAGDDIAEAFSTGLGGRELPNLEVLDLSGESRSVPHLRAEQLPNLNYLGLSPRGTSSTATTRLAFDFRDQLDVFQSITRPGTLNDPFYL